MPNVGGKKFPYTDEGKAAAKEEAAKSGKKMTMGYKKGGDVKKKKRVTSKDKIVPPYKAANKKNIEMDLRERIENKEKREAKGDKFAKDELKFNRTVPRKLAQERAATNNTSAPKPPTPPQAAMGAGAAAGGMAGGMGAKKPPMPGMKAGGKVKKSKSKSGGKVRGAGIAKKGVRKCKMR